VRLLFDENLSGRLVERLHSAYPGSTHVDLVGLTIVSKDNDFRQLSFLYGAPPKVVWLSVGNASTNAIAGLLDRHRADVEAFHVPPEESLLVLEIGVS
jgi:predicted nuclease of predicted toxin-antitoxin system